MLRYAFWLENFIFMVMYEEMIKTNFFKRKYEIDRIEVLLGESWKCIRDERWENFPNKGKYMPVIQKKLISIVLLAYMTFVNIELSEFLS